jgi:hypothetical protein
VVEGFSVAFAGLCMKKTYLYSKTDENLRLSAEIASHIHLYRLHKSSVLSSSKED